MQSLQCTWLETKEISYVPNRKKKENKKTKKSNDSFFFKGYMGVIIIVEKYVKGSVQKISSLDSADCTANDWLSREITTERIFHFYFDTAMTWEYDKT